MLGRVIGWIADTLFGHRSVEVEELDEVQILVESQESVHLFEDESFLRELDLEFRRPDNRLLDPIVIETVDELYAQFGHGEINILNLDDIPVAEVVVEDDFFLDVISLEPCHTPTSEYWSNPDRIKYNPKEGF